MTFKIPTRVVDEGWVTTPDAERILGIPRDSLKRIYSDATEGGRGILKHGIHWKRGANRNASHNWNIPACIDALRAAGHIFTDTNAAAAPTAEVEGC